MTKGMQQRVRLNNKQELPLLGLGTYLMEGKEAEEVVYAALMKGYRLIDSASMYGNEAAVGRAVRKAIKSGIPREEITVVTKIWKTDMGYGKALKAFEKSYELLKLDVVDLLLIHWPDASDGVNIKTWKAMEELYYGGKAKTIGVSNFNEKQLKYLFKWGDIKPAVNQFSSSPGNSQEALRSFCEQSDIRVMAYSPIQRGKLLEDPSIQSLAKKYQKTPAQISLRWNIQRGVIPIPKTAKLEHLDENMQVFDFSLTQEEMALLLNKG